jgi:GrpB-like predicted nucleotidyltransferase (UPF0157 family)
MTDTFLVVALGFSVPVYFLPTACAYLTRKRGAAVFLLLNFLLIGFWLLKMSMDTVSSPMALVVMPFSLDITLALWLMLLHFSLRRDEPTPEELDEPVKLVEHDSQWNSTFVTESERISSTLSLPAGTIEHIGSTSVPGLTAKPVVDMMLGVPKYPPTRDLLSRLQILGYENLGEAGVPGRVYLRLRGERDFNLHVLLRDGEHWTNNLALRELLRSDPAALARYAEAKSRALETGGNRLLGYSSAKDAVVGSLLAQAKAR